MSRYLRAARRGRVPQTMFPRQWAYARRMRLAKTGDRATRYRAPLGYSLRPRGRGLHPDFTGLSAAPRISKRRAPLQTDGKGLAPYAGCLSKKAPSGGMAGPCSPLADAPQIRRTPVRASCRSPPAAFRLPDTDPLTYAARTLHHLDCRARRTKYRPQKTQPMTGPTLVIDPRPDAGPVCQHKKGVPGRGRRASGRGGETRSLKDGRPSV